MYIKYLLGCIFSDDINHVIDNIFIGNWNASTDIQLLKKYGIKMILCLNTTKKQLSDLRKYDNNNIQHIQIECVDAPGYPIQIHFDGILDIVYKCLMNNINILIHCTKGSSRSAIAVILCLMNIYNQSYNDAYNILSYKRWRINPNAGFIQAVKDYNYKKNKNY